MRWKNPTWFPLGVSGLDISRAAINTAILVSSSCVIYFAERALDRNQLVNFRCLWLLTVALGVIFLIGQAIEWRNMPFGLDAGLAGATLYLLTGFHGMHVLTGVVLMLYVYFRSLVPGNYNTGHQGVSVVSLFWHFVDIIWIILFLMCSVQTVASVSQLYPLKEAAQPRPQLSKRRRGMILSLPGWDKLSFAKT